MAADVIGTYMKKLKPPRPIRHMKEKVTVTMDAGGLPSVTRQKVLVRHASRPKFESRSGSRHNTKPGSRSRNRRDTYSSVPRIPEEYKREAASQSQSSRDELAAANVSARQLPLPYIHHRH